MSVSGFGFGGFGGGFGGALSSVVYGAECAAYLSDYAEGAYDLFCAGVVVSD